MGLSWCCVNGGRKKAAVPVAGASVGERIKHLGGPRGLYRGAAPGIISGGFRNGEPATLEYKSTRCLAKLLCAHPGKRSQAA